jgi:hypothetical protein
LGLDGTVSVIGVPAPGEDGQAALRLDLQVDEFVLPLPVGALTVEDITVVGTSAINAIELDASGYGEVPPGDLVAAVRFDVDAELFVPPFSLQQTEAFLVTNAEPIAVDVDWAGGEAAAYGALTGVVNDGLLDHDFELAFDLVS